MNRIKVWNAKAVSAMLVIVLPFWLDGLRDVSFAQEPLPSIELTPQQDRFDRVILTEEIADPMEIDIAHDGRVFIAERSGAVKIYDPATSKTTIAGEIAVHRRQEDGLLGLALSPNFEKDGFIYLMYSRPHPTDICSDSRVSRFGMDV